MAVNLDIKTIIAQQSNGSQVKIFDNSGDYDVNENPSGWGDGTTAPARSAVTQITINVEKGDITYQKIIVDSTEIEDYLNGTGTFISSSDSLGAEYPVFDDGKYGIQVKIEGTWSGSPSPYEAYDWKYTYFLWKMYCDIRKLVIGLDIPIRNHLESYNSALLLVLFDDILFSCQYGDIQNADKIYNYLRDVLDNETVLTELFKNFRNYA